MVSLPPSSIDSLSRPGQPALDTSVILYGQRRRALRARHRHP
jgi:hypothetical protein